MILKLLLRPFACIVVPSFNVFIVIIFLLTYDAQYFGGWGGVGGCFVGGFFAFFFFCFFKGGDGGRVGFLSIIINSAIERFYVVQG